MVLGLVGFILSAVIVSGCHFFDVSATAIAQDYGSYGLFKYDVVAGWGGADTWTLGCTKYPNKEPTLEDRYGTTQEGAASVVADEGSFKAAQAMGAVAAAISGLAMIASLLMLFLKFPRWAFKTLSGCYFFCFATQLLTFLILNNDACNGNINDMIGMEIQQDIGLSCELATDSYTAIVAGIFFLTLGVLILVCPTPKAAVISAQNCGGASCCSDQQGSLEEGQRQVVPEPVQKLASLTVPYNSNVMAAPGDAMSESTLTETFNPDGTITIREEKVNYDGSKSITITTKPAASL